MEKLTKTQMIFEIRRCQIQNGATESSMTYLMDLSYSSLKAEYDKFKKKKRLIEERSNGICERNTIFDKNFKNDLIGFITNAKININNGFEFQYLYDDLMDHIGERLSMFLKNPEIKHHDV